MAMDLRADLGGSGGDGCMIVERPEEVRDIRTSGAPTQVYAGDGVRVFMHAVFVNSYAVAVAVGDSVELLVVDTGLQHTAPSFVDAVQRWLGERLWSSCRLHTVVYTHGHADHAFGTPAWLDAGKPPGQIVAHRNVAARAQRYAYTHGLNKTINKVQFSLPGDGYFPVEAYVPPTLLYDEALALRIGDSVDVQLQHYRGETDDATVVFLPRQRVLFTGDLVIWQAPNCGNPQKVQRYCLDWAHALQRLAALNADVLLPGHGYAVVGAQAISDMLLNTSRYLLHLEEQTVALLNSGATPEHIAERVAPEPRLSRLPYLAAGYDHPTFIVRNILRLYAGWWNGDPAALLPAPSRQLAELVVDLAGGVDKLVERADQLLAAGQTKLAAHLAVYASRAQPDSRAALLLLGRVFEARLNEEDALMAKGVYRHVVNEARDRLAMARL